MAKIFWVTCPNPKCGKRFYASVDDYKDKERKLMCPFCQERFLDKESKEAKN
jgi:DNA-directed RNA polymerase subunit RPC12/RpoP